MVNNAKTNQTKEVFILQRLREEIHTEEDLKNLPFRRIQKRNDSVRAATGESQF